MLESISREELDKMIKLYPKEELIDDKREPDECFSMALEIYSKSAILAGYGDAYLATYTIPDCKAVLENKIYNLVDSLLIKIKAFDEKCGFPEQYSEELDKLGELNFQRMFKDAMGMMISFEEIIDVIYHHHSGQK
jgi:hypothetical protein